ncbi:MAG: 3'(2'), 5'-bisphosphate nucleotidase [Verrucomicrobiales bacterium]|jgi:3'(2'), 5'-bisphosphate nucleotidase
MTNEVHIDTIIEIARRAGEATMEIYQREFSIEEKEDRSPLTEADQKSNEIIIAGLLEAYPEIPTISEEIKALPYEERKTWDRFWLIDPLDGTKEFIKKNGEFTVNIALIDGGIPTLGVVYQPAAAVLYYGSKGKGAFKIDAAGVKTELHGGEHYSKLETVRVVASRSHMSAETEEFVEELRAQGKTVDLASSGSSLKLCMIADGSADVYPRFAPTMEWDTGAAHAVALEAGRQVLNRETGEPLQYNKENLLNPWFIVE